MGAWKSRKLRRVRFVKLGTDYKESKRKTKCSDKDPSSIHSSLAHHHGRCNPQACNVPVGRIHKVRNLEQVVDRGMPFFGRHSAAYSRSTLKGLTRQPETPPSEGSGTAAGGQVRIAVVGQTCDGGAGLLRFCASPCPEAGPRVEPKVLLYATCDC